jgi:hypothetical protein
MFPTRQRLIRLSFLRYIPDNLPHLVGLFQDVMSINPRGPRSRVEQSRQHPDRSGLARAVRADQSEYLTPINSQVQPINGHLVLEFASKLLRLYYVHRTFPFLLSL